MPRLVLRNTATAIAGLPAISIVSLYEKARLHARFGVYSRSYASPTRF